MTVPRDVFKRQLAEFVRSHLVPQMKANADKFLVSFAVTYKEPDLVSIMESFGLVGDVDLDRIDAAMRSGFNATTDGRYRLRHKALQDDLIFSLTDWETFKAQIGG